MPKPLPRELPPTAISARTALPVTPWAMTGTTPVVSTIRPTTMNFLTALENLQPTGMIAHAWTMMLEDYPDTARKSNIQCENCHGPQDYTDSHPY